MNIVQDQAGRDTVQKDLERNLMVLAGAGAGKTHELIGRMVNCVCRGQVEVDRIAAITFTRKAAGEMRGRFFVELRKRAQKAAGREVIHIRRALEKIDQCFIGTIHSFCGRLLRERPLEAGLAPDFTEVEERDEAVLRRDTWDRFIQRCFVHGDPRLDELDELGLRTEDLYTFFVRRCLFSDVKLKETDAEVPELQPTVAQTEAFISEVREYIPDELPKGQDPFMDVLTRAGHFLSYRGMGSDSDRIAFLKLLEGNVGVKVTYWGSNKDFARQLRDKLLPSFQEDVLEPVLRQWRQYVYRNAAAFVNEAMRYYDGERHTSGKLTFQDLLLKAATLLRDRPGVRRYFQQRYQCLFVDEFQDTDPIQAEVVLYLTGTDTEEKDWRKLTPREGSLFLVGDEKQSIYRFRRADVETFRLVGDRIEATGGKVVQLNTSFRSLGRLCGWINGAFEPLFADSERHYQAEFGRLFEYRPDGVDAHCVRKISIGKVYRHNRAEIASLDAERIADFIAAAVVGQTEFSGHEDGAVLEEPVSHGHFMILTRTTGCLAIYARALEKRGLPYDIVGGQRLGEAAELVALMDMLESVYMPDNPLPLLGYLRGPLVGLGDDELYAYSKAGGRFNYRCDLPDELPEGLHQRLRQAFGQLDQLTHWMQGCSPTTAFERLLSNLGLTAFSASEEMGSSRAGNLLRLLALVREWENQGMHWGQILVEMRELIDDPEYKVEEMTLESGQEDVVRLMNLHQAKGLEGRVVFLADPYDTYVERHGVDFHVSRTGETPFLSMPVRRPRGPYHMEIIGEPQGWTEDAEEEERFLQAENLRLLYVAATRARNLLVVSCYEGNRDRGPWSPLCPYLKNVPELPVYAAPPLPGPEVLPLDWDAQRSRREGLWQAIQRPTYALHSITEVAMKDEVVLIAGEGRGREYGSAIHRLFDAAVQGRLPVDETPYIHRLLEEAEVPPAFVEDAQNALDAFRASSIWEEIQIAEAVYTEVPFAVPDEEEEIPGVLRGVIDLVYRVSDGWKLVDYKTDAVSEDGDIKALVDRYVPQVDAYARHWCDVTGEKISEKGFWLTEAGCWQGV